ncbi:MAG: D-alanyl-D-alanine carboxypeptidase/D-alanyl-D-alanine endopeptidase, partial [Acidimicrobiales bacterium]
GVREIRGRVLGDESRYDATRYVAGWPGRYITANEVGPLSALSVNDGFDAWTPRAVPFADPAAGAAGVLTELLRQRGVQVVGEAGSGTAPGGVTTIAFVDSPPVGDVVGEMLRQSDNGTAELLTKELGVRVAGEGSTAAGVGVVSDTLASLAEPTAGVVVQDGSGLDPDDRVTCRLLHDLVDDDDGGPIDRGLAVAGTTGTLTMRFVGTPMTGQLRAKTGTINGVASLSGVVTTQGGFELSFSSILNDIARAADAGPLETALGEALVRFPDLPSLEEIGPQGYPGAA